MKALGQKSAGSSLEETTGTGLLSRDPKVRRPDSRKLVGASAREVSRSINLAFGKFPALSMPCRAACFAEVQITESSG